MASTMPNTTSHALPAGPVLSLNANVESLQPASPPQKEHARLDMLWEAHVQNSMSFIRYQKTAVLLLSWEKSDLDTSQEV
jgi:hypothetical protein